MKFDWSAVEISMRDYAQRSATPVTITAATCREVYSKHFMQTRNTERITEVIATRHTVPNLERMSLEELIQHVDRKELELVRRKEKIFKRVLNSIGGDQGVTLELKDAAQTAYQQSVEAKELVRLKREKVEQEAREREQLEMERERLRARFEPDHVDAQGDDPLAHRGQFVEGEDEILEALLQLQGEGGSNQPSKELMQTLQMHRQKQQQEQQIMGPAADLESYFDTPEFDTLLTDLETEFAATAAGKTDGTYAKK